MVEVVKKQMGRLLPEFTISSTFSSFTKCLKKFIDFYVIIILKETAWGKLA